ncbi:unnamed protein product, partial [Discosporangium mesarthrocarpum]
MKFTLKFALPAALLVPLKSTVEGFRPSVMPTRGSRTNRAVPTSAHAASIKMGTGEPFNRRQFVQAGLVTVGCVMTSEATSAARADTDDGEDTLLNAMRDPPPHGEDVLLGSKDALPNRTQFEMQYELFKRGMELENESNYEAAERQWTEIIDNFNSPNFRAESPANKFVLARAYSNRGNARLTLQRTTEAIVDYSASIDLVPEHGEFWLQRGVAYEDMADRNLMSDNNKETVRSFYESALSDYDHAVVLDPQDPQVYISRGDACSLLGQKKEALDNYRRAVGLSPMIPEFRGKVALAEIQCGNQETGAYLIGELLKHYPDYPEMLLAGAAVAFQDGELAMSQALYNDAIHLDPRLLDSQFILLILRWPSKPLAMVDTMRKA